MQSDLGGDWIDDLVDAALEAGPKQSFSWLGVCPNGCGEAWHGVKSYKCPGSHVDDKALDAIQSQGRVDWETLWP